MSPAHSVRTNALRLVMFLCFCLLAAAAGAQPPLPGGAQGPAAARVLTGMVRTEADDPLPGATLVLKGTFIGSSTNGAGEFELSLPAGSNQESATISVAYPGFETLEIPLSAAAGGPLDLVLSPLPMPATDVASAKQLGAAPARPLADLGRGLARNQSPGANGGSLLAGAPGTNAPNGEGSRRPGNGWEPLPRPSAGVGLASPGTPENAPATGPLRPGRGPNALGGAVPRPA